MTQTADLTVLFADLRGSTGLFERMGNAHATELVTACIDALAAPVRRHGGRVVKTLGDGLLAVFPTPTAAADAAAAMHQAIDAMNTRRGERPAGIGMQLQVAVACGEVVEIGSDIFGDAVNVAARLVDHVGDSETLVTSEVAAGLPEARRRLFRSLNQLSLRGRAEPVSVHVLENRRSGPDSVITQFGGVASTEQPDALELRHGRTRQLFEVARMPIVLGRSPQSQFWIDDRRVSRSHARVDWHGGHFQITDLSFNGTYVRFNDGEIVSLRRGACVLHGAGTLGLGGSPVDPASPCVDFDVLRVGSAHAPGMH